MQELEKQFCNFLLPLSNLAVSRLLLNASCVPLLVFYKVGK